MWMILSKKHRKAGQTAGSNESNTSHGSTRAKLRGIGRKKNCMRKRNKLRKGHLARTTINISSILTAPAVLDWRRASAACGQLE